MFLLMFGMKPHLGSLVRQAKCFVRANHGFDLANYHNWHFFKTLSRYFQQIRFPHRNKQQLNHSLINNRLDKREKLSLTFNLKYVWRNISPERGQQIVKNMKINK